MVTIVDIARESGVSVGTASRVLNHCTNVSEGSRQKVMAAVEKLHYIPNESARYLKLNDTHTVVVIVKGIANTFFSPMIERITAGLKKAGYTTVLTSADGVKDEVFLGRKMIYEKKTNGIIFLGGDFTGSVEKLKHFPVPFVLSAIGASTEEMRFDNGSVIAGSGFLSSYRITDYLINLGHRSIAVLQADPESSMSKERLAGYRRALEDNRIQYDANIVFSAGDSEKQYSIEGGYRAMKNALKKKTIYTALEAFSDTLAFGAKRALIEGMYRIPEDISLTGIDGTSLALYSVPSITTMANDPLVLADHTVKMLLELMKGKSKGKIMQIEPHIIVGESTAKTNGVVTDAIS